MQSSLNIHKGLTSPKPINKNHATSHTIRLNSVDLFFFFSLFLFSGLIGFRASHGGVHPLVDLLLLVHTQLTRAHVDKEQQTSAVYRC